MVLLRIYKYLLNLLYKMSTETIVQVGCGVVGGAYYKAYEHYKFKTIGVDVMDNIINSINASGGECYHADKIPDTVDASIVLVSVPTPLVQETQQLNMKYVWSTLKLNKQLVEQSTHENPLVILRSTVPPGLTKEYETKLREMVTDGRNFTVLFQPEFLRAKSAFEDAIHPWRVVVGTRDNSLNDRLLDVFLPFVENKRECVEFLTVEEAEFFNLF
jgi:UDPglucose 6-dehydrogenase